MATTRTRPWLTPIEISRELNIGEVKVLGFIHRGELRAVDVSTSRGERPRWRISRSDLQRFLDGRACAPSVPAPKRRRTAGRDNYVKVFDE